MAEMTLRSAVSAPGSPDERYCLLDKDTRAAYQCAETAAKLGAPEEDVRLAAFWHHFSTHVEKYAKWAARKGLCDPTMEWAGRYEAAGELVRDVLLSFWRMVKGGRYDPTRGPPCRLIKQAIRNERRSRLRRGGHPTEKECLQCWEKAEECPAFRIARPWENARRRCYRRPVVRELNPETALFNAAGLEDEWPPRGVAPAAASVQRPVEELVAKREQLIRVRELIEGQTLTPDQRTVLKETFFNQRTSREIAEEIQTTPANVDQIRHRGLRRLRKALAPKK